MANELKTTKLVLIGGEPIRLPIRAADPGSALEGELYYNSTLKTVRVYDGTAWADVSGAVAAEDVSYDNTTSGLTATDVQAAIDEVDSDLDAVEQDVADLVTLSGVAANSVDLGSFTGDIIPDNSDVKEALQSLETAIEGLPDPITYEGTWSAATNTPTLANGVGNKGDLYQVIAAGSVDFGAGAISFEIGDKVVYNGTVWEKWDMTDAVASVNGQTGVVVLDTDDVAEGTAKYFTEQRVRDTLLTGGVFTEGVIAATDSVLEAFEKLDAEFANVGTGDVVGPASSVNNRVAIFDGTTGKLLKDSSDVTIDAGLVQGVTQIEIADQASVGSDLLLQSAAASSAGNSTIASTDKLTIDSALGMDILAVDDIKISTGASLEVLLDDSESALVVKSASVQRTTSNLASAVEERYSHNLSLAANISTFTNISGLEYAIATYAGFEMSFVVREATSLKTRIGTLRVVHDGTNVTVVPVYTETDIVGNVADGEGLKFNVVIDAGSLKVQFKDTHATNACSLKADVKLFKL